MYEVRKVDWTERIRMTYLSEKKLHSISMLSSRRVDRTSIVDI